MEGKLITIYATQWCGDCTRARNFFDRHGIHYLWIDIDADESGEEFVISTNNGMRSVPTILFEDGSILVEPSEAELERKLGTSLPTA